MSKAIQQFNGLNGTIGIPEVEKLAELAKAEGQTQLYNRLTEGLEEARARKITKFNPGRLALEEIPAADLPGIDLLPSYASAEEFTGLNKAVSPDEIYQYITDLMLKRIEKAGSLPWHKMWEDVSQEGNFKAYQNFDSKKAYRGINFFLLNVDDFGDIVYRENPYFLTFKQIETHGGQLKQGSKGVRIVYFIQLYHFSHHERSTGKKLLEFGSYNQKKYNDWLEKNKAQIESLTGDKIEKYKNRYIPILKYYNVFSGEDVTGIDFGDFPKTASVSRSEAEKINASEAIIANYPNPPKIKFVGNQPAYYPTLDELKMTPSEQFKAPEFFYSVFFHELTHSTGHSKRLDRGNDTRVRDKSAADKKAYNFEELVAEMGAVFLSAESGTLFHTRDQSAVYLSHYINKLKANMKEDNRFFFRAASASQAAADYILDRDKDGNPAYLKTLEKSPASILKKKDTGSKKENVILGSNGDILPNNEFKGTLTDTKETSTFTKNEIVWFLNLNNSREVVKVRITKVHPVEKSAPQYGKMNFLYDVSYGDGNILRKRLPTEIMKVTDINVGKKKSDIVPAKKKVVAKDENFKVGDTVSHRATGRIGKITKSEKPKKGSSQKNEQRVYSITYDDGKKGIFIAHSNLSKAKAENPISKSIKPKSISVASAIDDILNLPKYKGISKIQANILLKYFKDDAGNMKYDEIGISEKYYDIMGFEYGNLKKDTAFHVLIGDYDNIGALSLTPIGEELVLSIKNRLESKRNQKHNYALFDGLAGYVPENINLDDAMKFSKTHLEGKSIYHQDLGKKVYFTKPGIKKSIHGKGKITRTRLQLIYLAKDLLKKSRLYSSESDKKRRPNVGITYKLRTTTILDGEKFEVFITVQERENGTIYYDHTGIKLKRQNSVPGKKSTPLSRAKSPLKKNKVTKTKPNNKKGLKSPEIEVEPKPREALSDSGERLRPLFSGKHPKVQNIRHQQERSPMFAIAGETSKFLQAVEKKPIDSVVVTLDGPQGAGKTTSLYQFLNDFATPGNRCLFASLEEHPTSNLAQEKRDKYLSETAQANIDTVAEFDSYQEFKNIVAGYDAIFIDSWQKLIRMIGAIRLDEDVRKSFDGKVFFVIFQQTTEGRTKGGSEIVFDGDIIIKLEKRPSFADNYAYFDKNRYTRIPIENIKYMIGTGTTIIEGTVAPAETEVLAITPESGETYDFIVS